MSNDTINVQRGIVGAGSDDDTYVLSANLIDANAEITITDVEGANKIQLIGGLTITSSIVAGDTAQLTLSNGAVVTVLGASTMSYEVGGNPLTGTAGVTKDYSTFVADVLGTTVPTTGTSTGGESTVNEDGTATGGTTDPTDPNAATYALTAGATSVDEGGTATFNLATTNVTEGTSVSYTISGVAAADVSGGALTGSVNVGADGTATISVALLADLATEGAETLTVTIDGQSASASTTVNDTSIGGVAQTYTLTTSTADVVESSTANDTITGTTTTLQSGDIIIDASTTDNDTFNLTLTAANTATPIVQKIENVNVELDYFTGTAADLVMTNYTDSTVTLGSSKLGFNGITGATNVGGNTVKAGSNVNTITVTGVTTGTLDAGSAKTVNFTGTAAAANTIVVNGDIKTGTGLTNTASTLTTLNVTAASNIIYNTTAATAKTTITGDKDINLTMDAADIITGTSIVDSTTGFITLTQSSAAGATFDATNFDVDKIVVGNVATVAATVASGQLLETNANMTSLTVATTATTDTTATINVGHDLTTLVASNANLDTTINNTDANAIATLTATGQDITLTGAGNLTVGNVDAKTFNASAATGELNYTLVGTGTTQTISGTTGKNTVTLGNVADVISFTGQSGVDTIKADGVALTGTVAGDLGAGDDVVTFNTLGAGATVALVGGAGTDTLKITAAADMSAMGATGTWAVSGFETIQLQAAANSAVDAQAVTFYGSQLTDSTMSLTTQEAIDTVALTVTADGATTTLSGLVLQSDDTVAINGTDGSAQTIVGTSTKDTIDAGTGTASVGNTITGGAGDDTFVFAASDSTEASLTSITDYQAKAASSDNDTLDVIVTTLVADVTRDVSGVGTIFADKTQTVNAVVKDGVMSLSGLSADVALANTFAEMMDIAEDVAFNQTATTADILAFEFGGNTYLLSTTAGDATDAVIELTGVTGITAVSTSAADNTILVA